MLATGLPRAQPSAAPQPARRSGGGHAALTAPASVPARLVACRDRPRALATSADSTWALRGRRWRRIGAVAELEVGDGHLPDGRSHLVAEVTTMEDTAMPRARWSAA